MQAWAFQVWFSLAIGIISLLFFSRSKFAKTIRPFAWVMLLATGLWAYRENTRPDFYECEACGLEYTCEDAEGHEPHGYCEKTAMHKHRGSIVERYDFVRGAKSAAIWTLGGVEKVTKTFTPGGKDKERMVGTGTNS
jgi:hypothetical protein